MSKEEDVGHFGVIERQLGNYLTRANSHLERIAHAVEAIARKQDPEFKSLAELAKEDRRLSRSGRPET